MLNQEQMLKKLNDHLHEINLWDGTYLDYITEYDQEEDVDETLYAFAEESIPVYYYELNDFITDDKGVEYIEQAVAEFGIDSRNFDFYALIQQGINLYNLDIIYENQNELKALLKLENEELDQEELEEIYNDLTYIFKD